jgi:hypothetical protein
MRLSGDFWDVVKRATIYRTPVQRAKAETLLAKIQEHLNAILKILDWSLEEILEANYAKLADKDKGRYRSGNYSDQQAQERHDKRCLGDGQR